LEANNRGSDTRMRRQAALPITELTATALMDWAERNYAQFFPSHQADKILDPYVYRYYPETGNYLGVAGDKIYVLGPLSGGSLLNVGTLSDFSCRVYPANCEPAPKLYVGYYTEDPVNNPEDPTVGSLLLAIPNPFDNTTFAGLMPFSYTGCLAGADIGTISGTRSKSSISGNWTGTVDNVSVGGSYAGTYDAATDSFSGSYTNAAGKVRFGNNTCGGFIAGVGTWKVFGTTTNQPASFIATVTSGTAPRFSWPSLGSETVYGIRVFDEDCLTANVSSATCFKGETLTSGLTAQYPLEFPGASALVAGGHYLALVAGQSTTTGALLGFSSLRFSP